MDNQEGGNPLFSVPSPGGEPRPEGKGLSAVPRRGGAALNRRSGRTKPEHGWCKKGYRETPDSRRDGVRLMPSIKEQPKPQVRLRLLWGATYAIWKGYTLSGWGLSFVFLFGSVSVND